MAHVTWDTPLSEIYSSVSWEWLRRNCVWKFKSGFTDIASQCTR